VAAPQRTPAGGERIRELVGIIPARETERYVAL
jgi:hypothetical protein